MTMVTGEIVGRGFARTPGGIAVLYKLVVPDKSYTNTGITFPAEIDRWTATAARLRAMANKGQLDPQVANRAEFGATVLGLAATNVAQGVGSVMMAQAQDGRILSVMTYTPLGPTEASLNLLAVEPMNLAGTPGNQHLRGLGTAMVAGASRKFLRDGVQTVYLHPLDRAAETFWRSRGFGVCGAGGLMCIRGKQGIETLLGDCEIRPDCPDKGECLLCGLKSLYREPAKEGANRA